MFADAADPLNLDPTTLCVFGVAIVVWIAMLGVSLKLAFKVCGADPPGYFSCLGYALLLPTVNALITTVAYATVGSLYGLVGFLQLYIQIKILMVAGECGGWQAFFSGIVHGLFSGVATAVIFLAVLLSGTVDLDEFKGPLASLAKEAQAKTQSDSGLANGTKPSRSFMPWSTPRTADGAQINPYAE